jgi:hypothetical protein
MNRLYYRVKRLTAIIFIMAIVIALMIPVTVLITENAIDRRELWEVVEKFEMGREYLNRTGYAPYHVTVEREHVLLWIEVDWDLYLNLERGDLVRLNPDCNEIIGVIK